jgi:Major Facilitator Superfamily
MSVVNVIHDENDSTHSNEKNYDGARGKGNESGPEQVTNSSAVESSPSVSRWISFRTDILLMPLLTIAFGMQYYDKAILGSATLFGILTDLNLIDPDGKTYRYSQASACFYYGYLAGAIPMSILAQRWKGQLHIFLGVMVILWGIIVMLTCIVTDYRGLYAQRIFLGFVEASVSPGFVAITRMWYTKAEQPLRLGIWWSAVGLFSIVSGLINNALGRADTALADWKLMFLVPGAFTIFFGFLLLIFLPPSPLRSPLIPIPGFNKFNQEQREAIDTKVRRNMTGNERAGSSWNWEQAKEGLRDPQIYIFFLLATAIYVSNGAVTVFGPLLVKSIGFTSLRATILLTPGGATTAAGIYTVAFLATRKWVYRIPFARTALLIISCWPVIIGCAMCWRGNWEHKEIPLAGYYLIPIFGAPFVMMLGSCTANIAGSTKQAIASAAIFLGYNCGNIASSYILISKEKKDHYPTTFQIVIGCMCATMALAIIQALYLANENRKRDRLYGRSVNSTNTSDEKEAQLKAAQLEETFNHDLTDRQNTNFRYTY